MSQPLEQGLTPTGPETTGVLPPYEPVSNYDLTRVRLAELAVAPEVSNRDLYEVIADTFATCGRENWRDSDEWELGLETETIVLGHYAEEQLSWIERYDQEGKPSPTLHFIRDMNGRISTSVYGDGDSDSVDDDLIPIELDDAQRLLLAKQIYDGFSNIPPEEFQKPTV